MENFNLVVSIFSIAISAIAIYLSLHFYDKAKQSEKETSNSLVEIKTQTDMLQKLTGKWMDKFVRSATTDKPDQIDSSFREIIQIVAQIPHNRPTEIPETTSNSLSGQQTVNLYILLLYYSAQTNVWAGSYLPDEYDITDTAHTHLSDLLDSSYNLVQLLSPYLSGTDQELINSSIYLETYNATLTNWMHMVKNTTQRYEEKGDINE